MIKIVKDPHEEHYHVVAKLGFWDRDEEQRYSIIGSAKTEKEALLIALQRIYDNNKNNEDLLDKIYEVLGGENAKFHLDSHEVDLPRNVDPETRKEVESLIISYKSQGINDYTTQSDTRTSTKFYSMWFVKEENAWYRLYG